MRFFFLLLALAVAAPSLAAPLRLKGGPKSEEKLRRFVTRDAKLKARLEDAAKREAAFVAEARESDLRDAVSDTAVSDLHARLEKSTGEKRKAVLESLPGMKAASGPACATLAGCPAAETEIEVSSAQELPGALRRMIRPWMVLQQARGAAIEVATAEDESDAALIVTLKDSSAKPLTLNVSPHLLGGFSVWLDHPAENAELYARERQAFLAD